MATVTSGASRRLGLRVLVADHVETWTVRTGRAGRQDRRRAAAWYYGAPAVPAGAFVVWRVNLEGAAQLLAGAGVFTALLFGLLVLMFNTGVGLKKDAESLPSAHNLMRIVSDIRATVTYAAVGALLLVILLAVSAAISPPSKPLGWLWTPILVWLFGHIVLTLLTVLARLRTAFNYITR